ncbi:hypothetical protein A6F55_21100 [Prescottella equi]|nr:hypothetical protein A6F55_21100 [Prescottella equi]
MDGDRHSMPDQAPRRRIQGLARRDVSAGGATSPTWKSAGSNGRGGSGVNAGFATASNTAFGGGTFCPR